VTRTYRVAALASAMVLMASLAGTAQPPEKKDPPGEGKGQGKGDPKGKGGGFGGGRFGGGGFGGGFGPPQPGQILPTFMRDQLKLTDEQKKKVDELQKEVDDRLAKILTDEQKKQLKEMRERGPGGFGGGFGGGRFGGGGPPKKDP
jgi:Spy/CpxP family protein refolding chaperone